MASNKTPFAHTIHHGLFRSPSVAPSIAPSIGSLISTCLNSFNTLIRWITFSQRAKDFSIDAWADELGRLRIWAANSGAQEINQASLEFRLRDASHIRDQILSLLENLRARLNDACIVVTEGYPNYHFGENLLGEDSDDEGPLGDMKELLITVTSIMKSLFLMSILVRKPAQHDSRLAFNRSETNSFKSYDYVCVRDRYPEADEDIVSKLASAITRRRTYLRCQAEHAVKDRQGVASEQADKTAPSTIFSSTLTTGAQDRQTVFEEEISDAGASKTVRSWTPMSRANELPPPPPIEYYVREPFKCPICYYEVQFGSAYSLDSIAWYEHVFEDLRPYICLNADCTTSQKLYATRHEWLQHIETTHPRVEPESNACPLCGVECADVVQLNRHNAEHLEVLALHSLPQSLYDLPERLKTESPTRGSSIHPNRSDEKDTAAVSPDLIGVKADQTAARAKDEDSDPQDLMIRPGASDKANDNDKPDEQPHRQLVQEEAGREDDQEAKRRRTTGGYSSVGWWYCCHDNNLNNPVICHGKCSTCGHVKCSACGVFEY